MRVNQRIGALAALAAGVAGDAGATAFQLREGSATAMGTAIAGRSANDRDVSFSLYNPAALNGVGNFEVSSGVSALFAGSTAKADFTPAGPLAAFSRTDDPNEDAIIPSLAVGYRVTPSVVIGLAVDAPFGLATEYDDLFIGSFDGVRSELTTITATPMASWEVTPGFVLGAGVMVQYADAELQNRGAAGVQNVSGDGFDVGFTLGFIAEPTPGTKIGATFQTGFSHTLEGEFSDNFAAPGLTLSGGASGEARFDLPAVVSIGVIQDVTPDFRVMAEVEWTGWSAFDTLTLIDTDNGGSLPDPQNYENSFLASFGAEYDVDDRLTVRAGVAFDETPTTDAFRTVRTPDGDRIWLALGASYELTENIGVDAGYIYIMIDDATVTLRNGPAAGTDVNYTDGDVHLFAVNLRYAF